MHKLTVYTFIVIVLIGTSACATPQEATQIPSLPTEVTEEDTIQPVESADIIFYNGQIITIEASNPSVEALAVKGNTILALGSEEEILALQDQHTQLIDLQGAALLPGFIDGHTHILAFPDRMGRSLAEAQETAIRYGFTTVNEMWSNQDYLDSLFQAEQEGNLRMRVNVFACYNIGMLDDNNQKIIMKTWYPENQPILDPEKHLRIPGIKIFVDGAMTAGRGCWALSEPYMPDSPILDSGICGSEYGDLYWSQEELNQVVQEAQNAGYRVAFHAMGDQAIETALDAIEFALNGEPNELHRHQIQHNSLARPDQLPRYETLNVLASVRGYGNFSLPEVSELHFGPDRDPWYANRYALANMDIHAYLETDFGWTVDPDDRFVQRTLDPIVHLFGLVTHKYVNEDGSICDPVSWTAAHAISVERALEMMTIEPAYAVSMEDYIGSLKPGKYADLIILSDNPLSIDPDIIKDLKVWMTMIAGKVEYCDNGKDMYCPNVNGGEINIAPSLEEPIQKTQIMFNCDNEENLPMNLKTNYHIQTYVRWGAKTEEQVNDFIESADCVILVDNKKVDSYISHSTVNPVPGKDMFFVHSSCDVGKLESGTHKILTRFVFDKRIYDGYDRYGPGTDNPTYEGTCTVTIEYLTY